MAATGAEPPAMDDNAIACADLLRRADPERFRAVMAAPVAARARLFAIYAFNAEVARAPWGTAEPMIAEMRLQWWRDVVAGIAAGEAPPRQPVARALAAAIRKEDTALLDALVVARRWDIGRAPFAEMDALRDHLQRSAGNLLLVAARSLGEAPEEPLRAAGFAMGLAAWLRAVPALRRAGRQPLIEETPEALRALAEEGLARLAEARAARARIPPPVRPALLAVCTAGPVLRRVRADPRRVAEARLELPPIRSRLALIARAATGRW